MKKQWKLKKQNKNSNIKGRAPSVSRALMNLSSLSGDTNVENGSLLPKDASKKSSFGPRRSYILEFNTLKQYSVSTRPAGI